jgi:hypothetical protein
MSDAAQLTGEVSKRKIAAVFRGPDEARRAAEALRAALSLGEPQVQVIAPDEPHPGRKLEPESRGIWRTIVRAHLKLGVGGAIAGLVLFAALLAAGVPFVVNSPIAAALALLFFGTVAGLLLGGLMALRPDHDRYVLATRDAMADGRTTVVVHALTAAQGQQAADFLRGQGGDVTSTL